MKTILLLPLAGLIFAAASCRTQTPIDPMTMKPSTHCLPGDAQTEVAVEATK